MRVQPHIPSMIDDLAYTLVLVTRIITNIFKITHFGRELIVVHQMKMHSLFLFSQLIHTLW